MTRAYPTATASARIPEPVVVAGAGLVVASAIALDLGRPLPYWLLGLSALLVIACARPLYGFAALVGLVLVTEQYPESLGIGIEPWLPQHVPLYTNIKDLTPLSLMYANALELWLVLLVVVWLVRGVAAGAIRIRPVLCPAAVSLAALTAIATFVAGVWTGGDFKIALWEVRAFGYLFGLIWFVPQIVERRRDVTVLLWVIVGALGIQACQGLYRYFVVLRMQMSLTGTFMAHEDPVMFVPLFFLLVLLLYYHVEPRLTRLLAVAAPLMVAALALTQRRVAYVTLAVCAALFAVAVRPGVRRMYFAILAPVAVIGVLYVATFYGSSSPLGRPIERALLLFDSTNSSNTYRVVEEDNLKFTVGLYPWGTGFGQPFVMRQDLPVTWGLYDYIPHNEILWMWVKSGTPGFIVLMFFFARVIAEGVWAHRTLPDRLFRILGAVVAIAVLNQMIAAYYELQLTYTRNMVYLGTLLGLLGRVIAWNHVRARDLRRGPVLARRRTQ